MAPVQLQRVKSGPLTAEPKRLGRFTVTAASATDDAGVAGAVAASTATATAPSSAAGSTGPPSAPSSESGGVQRLGRFTVTPSVSAAEVHPSAAGGVAAAATEDSVTDECPTTPDSGSLCQDRERSEAGGETNVHDVFTFLVKKQEEMGQLFATMRAQVLQVMTGQALNTSSSSTSPATASNGGGQRSQSLAQSQLRKPSAASLSAGADTDEALNLWEALGKPIERATRRNKQLEDENERLKQAVRKRKQELQELQDRVKAMLLQERLSAGMARSGFSLGAPPVLKHERSPTGSPAGGREQLPSFGAPLMMPEAIAGEPDGNERSPLFLATSSQQHSSPTMLEPGQALQTTLQQHTSTPKQRLIPPLLSSASSSHHTPNFAAAASPTEEETPLTPMSPLPPDQDAVREEGTAEASPRTAHKASKALDDALKQVASSLDLEVKARADPSQATPAKSPTGQSCSPSVPSASAATAAPASASAMPSVAGAPLPPAPLSASIAGNQSGNFVNSFAPALQSPIKTGEATTLHRSESLPPASFAHRANRVEGCTADVEGYGSRAVYQGWRSHAIHAKSTVAELDFQTS
eukprot:TRINITY_DN22510_c0_g1_i1.p1 TRINITY_DN22510_c0_g1~~TRINITY_DN22510_c0_g1_i1.p1  ORF type:complete len:582 (-),score=124.15 TRINITY_DN22510_c0_g1_i1:195-1940(-)